MIHKMHALYENIPTEYLEIFENEYGLEVGSKPNLKVISLDFEISDEKLELLGTTLVDYDSKMNLSDFFYRGASAMSVSPFLTLYVSEEGLKTDGEYSASSKDYKKFIRIIRDNTKQNQDLECLYGFFSDHSHEIFEVLDQYLNGTKKNPFIFTISINGEYIGRSKYFTRIREKAAEDYFKDFYTLGNKHIVGRDMLCSMCNTTQNELWGYVSIYNFYASKTDLAPLAGGFDREQAHKNYPVCPQCATKLKKMRPVVNKYFNFKFCGFNYLLIPSVIQSDPLAISMEAIVEIMVAQHDANPDALLHLEPRLGEFSLGKRRKIIDQYSKEVFDYLAEADNEASFTMLFYAINNAEFKILVTIEDIFPCQFKSIFEAKDRAERYDVFHELPGRQSGEIYDLEFRFDTIKEFFPINDRIEGDFSKAFLELTRSIFMQKRISYGFLLHRITEVVRRRFANDQNYQLTTLKAFLLLKFLTHLDILQSNKPHTCKEVVMTGKFADFFKEHQDFFESSAKQYVFMTGVLTQYLINIQLQDKGSAPFRKRLNSLKMDKKLVHRVFTEAKEKLIQYDKNYYQELEQNIAELMIMGGIDELSNDEISFIFALGMTLNKKFKDTKKQEIENNQ